MQCKFRSEQCQDVSFSVGDKPDMVIGDESTETTSRVIQREWHVLYFFELKINYHPLLILFLF